MFNLISNNRISEIIAKNDHILSLEDKLVEDFASEENSLITYDQLKDLTEGKWYWVNPGVKYMPIDVLSETLHYRTIVDNVYAQWWFGNQNHDCWEMVGVRKGVFLESKGGSKYEVGQTKIFKPYEKHNPGGQNGVITDLDVWFSREEFKIYKKNEKLV